MNKDAKLIAEAYNNVSKTENVDIDTLIDTIKQNQIDKGNREFANAHAIGALSFLIKRALQTPGSLQDYINRSYKMYTTGE
jgi:hypothetical protein